MSFFISTLVKSVHRSGIWQYIKDKTTKWGIKLWVLAENSNSLLTLFKQLFIRGVRDTGTIMETRSDFPPGLKNVKNFARWFVARHFPPIASFWSRDHAFCLCVAFLRCGKRCFQNSRFSRYDNYKNIFASYLIAQPSSYGSLIVLISYPSPGRG